MSAPQKPAAGDVAEYIARGADEPVRCEILGRTAKRVRIWLRLAGGALAVRYVKDDRLKRIGGGLLETGGGAMKATERRSIDFMHVGFAYLCNQVEVI